MGISRSCSWRASGLRCFWIFTWSAQIVVQKPTRDSLFSCFECSPSESAMTPMYCLGKMPRSPLVLPKSYGTFTATCEATGHDRQQNLFSTIHSNNHGYMTPCCSVHSRGSILLRKCKLHVFENSEVIWSWKRTLGCRWRASLSAFCSAAKLCCKTNIAIQKSYPATGPW